MASMARGNLPVAIVSAHDGVLDGNKVLYSTSGDAVKAPQNLSGRHRTLPFARGRVRLVLPDVLPAHLAQRVLEGDLWAQIHVLIGAVEAQETRERARVWPDVIEWARPRESDVDWQPLVCVGLVLVGRSLL